MPHPATRLAIILSAVLCSAAASAAEPSGCAAFKWPVDRERAALTTPDPTLIASGTELAALPTTALALTLKPGGEAALPMPPERAPSPERHAGFLRVKQIAKGGTYTIALSAGGWVDVAQAGRTLKPSEFSGATDCEGIRKLVRYQLSAGEALVQISGVGADTIRLAILPAD